MTAVRQNGHGIRLVHDLPEGSARGCAPLPLATFSFIHTAFVFM